MIEDQDRCYRAVVSRDKRFDGVFYTGVLTTGIYCRPSCPAVTPKRRNVRFFVSAAAAQAAGLRACKRCRPDTTPGSPEWDVRADVAGRAMRLINDGVVERAGVSGLAARLGYSERQLNRVLTTELGAGPLALARARRAHTARILAETTAMPLADVAFAAGFASVRQFNATMRETYAVTPSALRGRTRPAATTGDVELRLAVREPFDGAALLDFLRVRAVPGVEEVTGETYWRTLRLPGGPGVVALTPAPSYVRCVLRLHDLADLPVAVERCRRLLDLDADPLAVADALGGDPVLGPIVAKRPGLRVPGAVDGAEIAVRAVLGQQVSVAAARTVAGRLTAAYGTPLASPDGALTHLFPTPGALAGADLPGPAKRATALRGLCAALASGELDLDRGTDRRTAYDALVALPGIGPWTASYVALRALGDPDAFLPTDLGVRHALAALGADVSAAEAWRPWRSYALLHLWTSLGDNA
ncbi:MAG TPA: AlkA N-terminal domain-containing protein [Frankiaceae bacterium]|nr:AlkA N-terminal domain-containing protein [Frankiaceae bacterium]